MLGVAWGAEVTILALYILKTREMQRMDSDGVMVFQKHHWEVTVRASFDVCLRRDIGDEGRIMSREPEAGDDGRGLLRMRFKALQERTDTVGHRKSPPEKAAAGEETWPPLLGESPWDNLLGQRIQDSSPQSPIFQPVQSRPGVHLHNPQFSHHAGSAAVIQISP